MAATYPPTAWVLSRSTKSATSSPTSPDAATLIPSPSVSPDVIGEALVTEADLQRRVRELGEEISRDYDGKDLFLVGVLKGAVFFLSDLMRALEVPCEVDFMAVASYRSSAHPSGVVPVLQEPGGTIEGKD